MSRPDLGEILARADREGWAIPAINVEGCEMAAIVIEVAEQAGSPLLLQVTPATFAMLGWHWHVGHLADLCQRARVPVYLHLDHASEEADVERALDLGVDTVMFDGSMHPLEENITRTRAMVQVAHDHHRLIEGEVGHVGRAGEPEAWSRLTSPEEAQTFARATGVDLLAVAVGTRHGQSPGEGGVRLDALAPLRTAAGVPLVLHGASGVDATVLRTAAERGIVKVNVGTAVRAAFLAGFAAATARATIRDRIRAAAERIHPVVLSRIEAMAAYNRFPAVAGEPTP